MAIENTQQYHGLYHVLGGIISPMDGIGPHDLSIDSLVERIDEGGVKEVILLGKHYGGRHNQLLYLTKAQGQGCEAVYYSTRNICWRRTRVHR